MKNYTEFLPILKKTSLFSGMEDKGIQDLLACFAPVVRTYAAGEIVLLAGFADVDLGIVLDGEIEAVKTTAGGAEITITVMGPDGVFGDILAASGSKSPVTITARTGCRALFIPHEKLLSPCAMLHSAHQQLLRNLISTLSEKYFQLSDRVDLLIVKSLRKKICLFLLESMKRGGSATFSCGMNRAQLARYLNCERSALSRELSRLRAMGLLETYRDSFKILDPQGLKALL